MGSYESYESLPGSEREEEKRLVRNKSELRYAPMEFEWYNSARLHTRAYQVRSFLKLNMKYYAITSWAISYFLRISGFWSWAMVSLETKKFGEFQINPNESKSITSSNWFNRMWIKFYKKWIGLENSDWTSAQFELTNYAEWIWFDLVWIVLIWLKVPTVGCTVPGGGCTAFPPLHSFCYRMVN